MLENNTKLLLQITGVSLSTNHHSLPAAFHCSALHIKPANLVEVQEPADAIERRGRSIRQRCRTAPIISRAGPTACPTTAPTAPAAAQWWASQS